MICPLAARLILAELPAACWHGSATTAEPPICFTFSWTTLEEIAASSVASLTGCVACQNAPVTAYVAGTETAGELVTFTETLPLESTFASRTHGLPLHPVP